MAQVKKSEVIQPGLFQAEITKGQELVKVLDGINKEMAEMLKISKQGIIKLDTKNLQSIQKFNQEFAKTKVVLSEKEKIQQQVIRTEKQLAVAISEQNKALVQNKERLKAVNQEKRTEARATDKQIGAYKRASAQLNIMVTKYQNMATAQKGNTKEGKLLLANITKLDTKLKSIDAQVGRNQRNVGNYTKALSGLRRGFQSVAGAAGVTFGIFGAFRLIKGATTIVRSFEDANATLNSVLQTTKEQTKELREDSLRLGETTAKSANEVTKLQIAYARLGFTQSEIIDLTEDTINGSIALKAPLDDTAELVGAVVNSFDDLSTTDAGLILDQMSLATSKSALNFEKLNTAIPIVAGAANTAGVSFTQLTALMGKLSDSGIDASSSATALRNIFIESAAQGLSYEEILTKISNSSDVLTASVDEFGKRSAVSSAILSKNLDGVRDLDEALQDAAGTAKQMADKELDTLTGDLTLLQSAWEGVVLRTNEASGAGEMMRSTVQFLTENLDAILQTILALTGAWIAWKVAVFAHRKAMAVNRMIRYFKVVRAGKKSILLITAAQKAWGVMTGILSGKLKIAAVASKAFGRAMKFALGPIGLVIIAITALIALFSFMGRGAREAAADLKKLKEALIAIKETEHDLSAKFLGTIENELNAFIDAEEKKIEALKASHASKKTIQAAEKKAALEAAALAEKLRAKIIKARDERDATLFEDIKRANADKKRLDAEIAKIKFDLENGNFIDRANAFARVFDLQGLKKELDEANAIIESGVERKAQVQEQAQASLDRLLAIQTEKLSEVKLKQAEKDSRTQLKILKDRLKAEKKLLEESTSETLQKDIAGGLDNILNAKDRANAESFLALKLEAKQTAKEIKELEALLSLAEKKVKELKDGNKDRLTQQKIEIEIADRDIGKQENKVDDELDLAVEDAKKSGEVFRGNLDEQNKRLFEQKRVQLERERKLTLDNTKLTEKERELINEQFRTKREELDREELESKAQINEELRDALAEHEAMQIQSRTEFYSNMNEIADAFAERERKRSQDRISDIDKEIAKRKDQVNKLQQLAQKQSGDAVKTIAFEERRIAELERKKKKEEAKQQIIEVALAAFKAYSSELETGKKPIQALGSTFKNITLLSQFVRSIPAFDVGSENLSSNQNLDGNGGFLAMNHTGEGIMTREENQERLKSGLSMSETVELTKMYSAGAFAPKYIGGGASVDMTPLANEMKGLRSDLSKLEITKGIEYDMITNTLVQIIKKQTGTERRASKVNRN